MAAWSCPAGPGLSLGAVLTRGGGGGGGLDARGFLSPAASTLAWAGAVEPERSGAVGWGCSWAGAAGTGGGGGVDGLVPAEGVSG